MLDHADFSKRCGSQKRHHTCPMGKSKINSCVTPQRQNSCWLKYAVAVDTYDGADTVDWKEFRKKIWFRDAGYYDGVFKVGNNWKSICGLWRCLTEEERDLYLSHEINIEDEWLNKILSVAHVESRGQVPEKSWKADNVVLIGSLFHTRLDEYKHPLIPNHKLPIEEAATMRLEWLGRARDYALLNRRD